MQLLSKSKKSQMTIILSIVIIFLIILHIIQHPINHPIYATDTEQHSNSDIFLNKKNIELYQEKNSDLFKIKNKSESNIYLVNIYTNNDNNDIIFSHPSIILKPNEMKDVKTYLINGKNMNTELENFIIIKARMLKKNQDYYTKIKIN